MPRPTRPILVVASWNDKDTLLGHFFWAPGPQNLGTEKKQGSWNKTTQTKNALFMEKSRKNQGTLALFDPSELGNFVDLWERSSRKNKQMNCGKTDLDVSGRYGLTSESPSDWGELGPRFAKKKKVTQTKNNLGKFMNKYFTRKCFKHISNLQHILKIEFPRRVKKRSGKRLQLEQFCPFFAQWCLCDV